MNISLRYYYFRLTKNETSEQKSWSQGVWNSWAKWKVKLLKNFILACLFLSLFTCSRTLWKSSHLCFNRYNQMNYILFYSQKLLEKFHFLLNMTYRINGKKYSSTQFHTPKKSVYDSDFQSFLRQIRMKKRWFNFLRRRVVEQENGLPHRVMSSNHFNCWHEDSFVICQGSPWQMIMLGKNLY